MERTLGGDRLGSGNKQKVHLHGYERSNHNMGYLWRSTMSAGTLVPFMSQVGLPGDTFDIDLDCVVKTHPTVGPLFGSFKVQLDIFTCPVRLYQGKLHNNKLGIGLHMEDIKLPIFTLGAPFWTEDEAMAIVDMDNSQINPSCIFSYLGIRGVGVNIAADGDTEEREFNGIPWLAYWDIYKQYYANKQEEIGAVIHAVPDDVEEYVSAIYVGGNVLQQFPTTDSEPLTSGTIIQVNSSATQPANTIIFNVTFAPFQIPLSEIGEILSQTATELKIQYDAARWGTRQAVNWYYRDPRSMPFSELRVQTFPLEDIDNMREMILRHATMATPFKINDSAGAPDEALMPWRFALAGVDGQWNSRMYSQEGLGLKTYQSDLFNNWLQTEWIDGPNGINELTKVSTVGDEFTIDTLILARKVYDMLNRIAVSGGSYDDWMDVQWGETRHRRTESPIYEGGLSKELVFQEVVSNSESTSGDTGQQPLGTLAGKGVMAGKHKGGKVTVKVEEPSYILGIVSLTPRIDYSQGNQWDVHLKTMADFHVPAMDNIGFQELITEQMAWWNTNWEDGQWVTRSAGKQPAWINYKTNVNKVLGNFAIANNEMFMTLNRRYRANVAMPEVQIDDLTTYIDPTKYNQIFAQTSLDSQNFWVQIAVDMVGRRKISQGSMPNL